MQELRGAHRLFLSKCLISLRDSKNTWNLLKSGCDVVSKAIQLNSKWVCYFVVVVVVVKSRRKKKATCKQKVGSQWIDHCICVHELDLRHEISAMTHLCYFFIASRLKSQFMIFVRCCRCCCCYCWWQQTSLLIFLHFWLKRNRANFTPLILNLLHHVRMWCVNIAREQKNSVPSLAA